MWKNTYSDKETIVKPGSYISYQQSKEIIKDQTTTTIATTVNQVWSKRSITKITDQSNN